jgi:hypothetical protein
MQKPITTAQLINGGSVIKQGHKFTLGFNLFDVNGELVNLTGSTVTYKIAGVKSGVVKEGTATIKGTGHVEITVADDIGNGEMRLEFTATNSSGVQKYPANNWIRLHITPSLDDLAFTKVSTITVEQFQKQFDTMDAKANDALEQSAKAITTSDNVKTEFDQVVQRATDSDAMSAQAAVDAKGVNKVNLKTRLDDDYNEVTAKLAQNTSKLSNIFYEAPLPNGTDDTQNIFDTLKYCVKNNFTALFRPGTYIVTPNIIELKLLGGEQLRIKGYGKATIFKRKNMTTTANGRRLFRIDSDTASTNTTDVELVQLEDFFIDSNARNQQTPPTEDPYYYQHCADFFIQGKTNSWIKNVIIRNLYCDDGVADHIYIPGANNSWIHNLYVDSFEVYSRSRVRSDITVTGGARRTYINNFKGKKLEIEINDVGGEASDYFVTNSIIEEQLDLGGQARGINVNLNNVKSLKNTALWNTTGKIVNSSIAFDSSLEPRINYVDMVLQDVDIDYIPTSGNVVKPITIYNNSSLGSKTEFNNCRFNIKGTGTYTTTSAIWGYSAVTATLTDICKIKIKDCIFDSRFTRSIDAERCGTVELINNKYAGVECAIHLWGTTSYPLKVSIDGGDYTVCNRFLKINDGSGIDISMKNIRQSENNGKNVYSSGFNVRTLLMNDRKIFVTAPPAVKDASGFAGDLYVLSTPPVSGQPYQWVSTITHYYNTQPVAILTMP